MTVWKVPCILLQLPSHTYFALCESYSMRYRTILFDQPDYLVVVLYIK